MRGLLFASSESLESLLIESFDVASLNSFEEEIKLFFEAILPL